MLKNWFTTLLLVVSFMVNGQDQPYLVIDSTKITLAEGESIELFSEVSSLDPRKAALYSALLPGLGQIYNKQYWKVPIVLTGMFAFGHFINYNNKLYHAFRNATVIVSEYNLPDQNPYSSVINNAQFLELNRDNFRRSRDFMMIIGTAFYLFQIVDAHVSAHLNEFNVNDDLALKIKPSIQSTPLFSQSVGASLTIRFK